MIDLFLFSYVAIGSLYTLWLAVRYWALMRSRGERAWLMGIAFFLWPVVWGGIALDKIKARWRRRSLEFR